MMMMTDHCNACSNAVFEFLYIMACTTLLNCEVLCSVGWWEEPRYSGDHRAMHSKFRSRLGLAIVPLCHGTGAPFDEHMQAPPSDIWYI